MSEFRDSRRNTNGSVKNKAIGVRLDEGTWELLREHAKNNRRSISADVGYIIVRYLKGAKDEMGDDEL